MSRLIVWLHRILPSRQFRIAREKRLLELAAKEVGCSRALARRIAVRYFQLKESNNDGTI